MRRQATVVAAGVLLLLTAISWGDPPPFDVRAYVSPATNYSSGDYAFCENMSVVRKPWVVEGSGYSTDYATAGDQCPDPEPWGAGTGGAVLLPATPWQRIAGLLPMIGRPFHPGLPGEPDWNSSPWLSPAAGDTSSFVHLRAAGLAATGGRLVPANGGVRFLVIQPGAVRAAATAVVAPNFLNTGGDPGDYANTAPYVVHVNPYRVSDGDVWYIRHYERRGQNVGGHGPFRTRQVRIEVYSRLYGLDFQLDTDVDNRPNLNVQYDSCQILTNSGAARIEVPRQYSDNDELEGTWIVQFTIRSNTQTVPSPTEMHYSLDDEGGTDLYSDPAHEEPDLVADINAVLPEKSPYVEMSGTVESSLGGSMATADAADGVIYAVKEKADNGTGFATDECWPYHIPAGAVGLGRAILQWSNQTPVGALAGNDVFYRSGKEWRYVVDPDDVDRELVRNGDVEPPYTDLPDNRIYADCTFLSTRPNVRRTEDIWATSGAAIETDTDPASGGYPRVIVAEGADPATPGSTVGGQYNPGSSTPARPFYVGNRVAEPVLISPLRLGGCGAIFRDRAVTGDPNDLQVGDPCPISNVALRCDTCGALVQYDPDAGQDEGEDCPQPGCTGTLHWPVRLERAPAGAALGYATPEPLVSYFDDEGRGVTMPPEVVKFGPANSMVPLGVAEFLQTVRVDIPKYQPPSVPAGANAVENNLANDSPYVGTAVAFVRELQRGGVAFTDGFETHDVAASTSWTQYRGNNPVSVDGGLLLEDAAGTGTGTRTAAEYPVRGIRYEWRAKPQYRAGAGAGMVHFILAADPTQVNEANASRPRDGIWTRFCGYQPPAGGDGDHGAAGGWSVEVRNNNQTTVPDGWSVHYQAIQTNPNGIANASGQWYDFAIEIGDDLRPKFYYQGRLMGSSPVPLAEAEDYTIFLYTSTGDSVFDYVQAGEVTAVSPVDRDGAWTAYYLSPNDGEKIPAGNSPNLPAAQVAAEITPPPLSEYYCPVTDIRYSRAVHPVDDDGDGICDFSGELLEPGNSVDEDEVDPVPEHMLAAEEFDLFDILVSVLRKAELASDQRAVDLGWVAPGVERNQPNTTGTPAAGSAAVPSDQSSREDLTLRNEGNVPAVGTMRAGYMFLPEIDAPVRSRARWAQSVPLTVGTLFRYRPNDVAFTGAGLPLHRQDSDGAAGLDATAQLQAGVRAAAGEPYGPREVPVPLGQPVGNYTGETLVFLDLDGDTHLDFIDAEAGVTSTATHPFDPEVDEPLEPVSAFATRLRVVESRLPQNDFYSQDLDPTGLYDPDRSNLQVIWSGNRLLGTPPAGPGAEAPVGTGSGPAPGPTDALNILYANAALNPDASAAADSYYRGWLWADTGGVIDDARVLSNDVGAAGHNTSPAAYMDPNNNNRWVMWHRQTTNVAGMSTQLRFDSSASATWSGSGVDEFIYGTTGARQGLTGFVRQGAENNHWLFWHGGAQGSERIRYRWNFDPASRTVDNNEAELPISNAAVPGSRYDVSYEPVLQCTTCSRFADSHVYDAGAPCPYAGCAGTLADVDSHGYRKPSHYPFTYVKDPSVFEQISGGRPFVHAFFSGLVRATGSADICWVRFNEARMQDYTRNWGKVAFPRIADNDLYMPPVEYDGGGAPSRWAGEQLRPGLTRRVFQTRHLDWMVSDDTGDGDADNTNFANSPDITPRLLGGYGDPELFVGVITEAGGVRNPILYRVTWNQGSYDRATGTYVVRPLLWQITPTGDVDIAVPPGHPHPLHANELLEPSARVQGAAPTEEWPSVQLRINPASGTVTWSAPLFNPDAPGDQRAVFNTDFAADIVDVLMYANYTPYLTRVTSDPANDDCPSAFYDVGESSRLTVFWRRSFGTTDTPHFGRAAFMHKTYTTAIQVGQPPINGSAALTLTDLNDGGTVPYTVDNANGIITITDPSRVGNLIRVNYTSAGPAGAETEIHRIVGWSTETPIPVNAVVSEGALRVLPEIYQVPDGLGGAGVVDVVRYWLFWSSPRSVYDLREVADNGQTVKQSSDVYCAVVAPEYGSLIREAEVPRVGP